MKKAIGANIFLCLLWVAFTGVPTMDRLFFGITIILFLQWLYVKWLHSQQLTVSLSLRLMNCWIRFMSILLYEVMKANVQVAILVLKPKIKLSQGYFYYKPKLKTDFAKMVFANSITLTPGTITVDYVGDEMIIHYLTESSTSDLVDSNMEKILLEMEALTCSN